MSIVGGVATTQFILATLTHVQGSHSSSMNGWIWTSRDTVVYLNLLQKSILHFYVDKIQIFH